MLLRILRLLLYAQLLLGLILAFGPSIGIAVGRGAGDIHSLIGIVIAVAALIALRPLPTIPDDAVRGLARFFPLLPLALGLGFMVGAVPAHTPIVAIHMILGILTIALVEIAAGRQRRALRSPSG